VPSPTIVCLGGFHSVEVGESVSRSWGGGGRKSISQKKVDPSRKRDLKVILAGGGKRRNLWRRHIAKVGARRKGHNRGKERRRHLNKKGGHQQI